MNKASCMGNLQYSAYLRRDFQHLLCLQLAALRNQLLQGGAMNILHDQKILPHLLDKVIDGDCVRVCKRRGGARLAAEAFYSAQIIFVQGAQDLHRHDALYAVIPGLEDAGHTAGGDMFTNLVAPSNQGAIKLVQLLTSNNPRKHGTLIHSMRSSWASISLTGSCRPDRTRVSINAAICELDRAPFHDIAACFGVDGHGCQPDIKRLVVIGQVSNLLPIRRPERLAYELPFYDERRLLVRQ